MKKIHLIAPLMVLITLSCKHHPDLTQITPDPTDTTSTTEKPCNPDSVYFVNDILPIIASNCAKSGCHDPITHTKDLVLNSYSEIMEIVKKFQANNSDLYEVITETDPDKLMPPPPNNPLTPEQIALIYTWIMQGAPNNSCNSCDTTSVSFSQHILPIMNQSCFACHSGASPSGGILLTNYTQVKAQVLNGKLVPAVKRTGPKPMPPAASLPTCSINKIAAWVNAGALDN